MKHQTLLSRNPPSVTARILGVLLAAAPLAPSASIPPEKASEDVFAAEITGTGTWTDQVWGVRSWVTFTGMEGFSYEVYASINSGPWTLRGSAVVVGTRGLFGRPPRASSSLPTPSSVVGCGRSTSLLIWSRRRWLALPGSRRSCGRSSGSK